MKIYEAELKWTVKEEVPDEKLNSPELIAKYMAGAFAERPEQETVWLLFLDQKNFLKGKLLISIGTLTSSIAHPRDIFRAAILASCASIIITHNHPSGDPSPGAADIEFTRKMREAARIMDINFLDHVIVGVQSRDPRGRGYYSFREDGVL